MVAPLLGLYGYGPCTQGGGKARKTRLAFALGYHVERFQRSKLPQGNALVVTHISTPAMLALFGRTENAKASGEKTGSFFRLDRSYFQRVGQGDSTLGAWRFGELGPKG